MKGGYGDGHATATSGVRVHLLIPWPSLLARRGVSSLVFVSMDVGRQDLVCPKHIKKIEAFIPLSYQIILFLYLFVIAY